MPEIIHKNLEVIDIVNGARTIRIAKKHEVYVNDIVAAFDHFFTSVYEGSGDFSASNWHPDVLVDFSKSAWHPIFIYGDQIFWRFPSFPESALISHQYIELLNISNTGQFWDLGAYSGLTSKMIQDICRCPTIVAVEPDPENSFSIRWNWPYFDRTRFHLEEKAVWWNNGGIDFSSEGNMGSSAIKIVGEGRGNRIKVPTITLTELAKKYNPTPGDLFIKCDIEGAEAVIFSYEAEFLAHYRPQLVIEPHHVDGKVNIDLFRDDLERIGYKLEIVDQPGSYLPLVVARI